MELPKIKSVTAIKKYVLHVVFTDGTEGNYDVSHLAGKGVFKAWDNDNSFYNVFINAESGAISWNNDLDIDTINVYCTVNNIDANTFLTKEHYATY